MQRDAVVSLPVERIRQRGVVLTLRRLKGRDDALHCCSLNASAVDVLCSLYTLTQTVLSLSDGVSTVTVVSGVLRCGLSPSQSSHQ
jgi:hypothetical protein